MGSGLYLRRKITFKAHGRKVVFIKKPAEHIRHVLMKAFLWAIYLPRYPGSVIEVPIGTRYTPDVVALGENGAPRFWGEAGKVSVRKMRALVKRYRHTHLAFAKWDADLAPLVRIVEKATADCPRTAPVDLISFPHDSEQRFIDDRGRIDLSLSDVTCRRFPIG